MRNDLTVRQNNIARELRLKRLINGIRSEQKVTWEELAKVCEVSRQHLQYVWKQGKVEMWMYLSMIAYLRIPEEEVLNALR